MGDFKRSHTTWLQPMLCNIILINYTLCRRNGIGEWTIQKPRPKCKRRCYSFRLSVHSFGEPYDFGSSPKCLSYRRGRRVVFSPTTRRRWSSDADHVDSTNGWPTCFIERWQTLRNGRASVRRPVKTRLCQPFEKQLVLGSERKVLWIYLI